MMRNIVVFTTSRFTCLDTRHGPLSYLLSYLFFKTENLSRYYDIIFNSSLLQGVSAVMQIYSLQLLFTTGRTRAWVPQLVLIFLKRPAEKLASCLFCPPSYAVHRPARLHIPSIKPALYLVSTSYTVRNPQHRSGQTDSNRCYAQRCWEMCSCHAA